MENGKNKIFGKIFAHPPFFSGSPHKYQIAHTTHQLPNVARVEYGRIFVKIELIAEIGKGGKEKQKKPPLFSPLICQFRRLL